MSRRLGMKDIKPRATNAVAGMSNEEAAEFYSELADWAYTQYEIMTIDNDCEMQNYDE